MSEQCRNLLLVELGNVRVAAVSYPSDFKTFDSPFNSQLQGRFKVGADLVADYRDLQGVLFVTRTLSGKR